MRTLRLLVVRVMRNERTGEQRNPSDRRQLQYRSFERLQHSSMMNGRSSTRHQ